MTGTKRGVAGPKQDEDLRRNPENGWALYGLMQALDAQSKKAESGEVKKRFDKAWAHADITLTASRI